MSKNSSFTAVVIGFAVLAIVGFVWLGRSTPEPSPMGEQFSEEGRQHVAAGERVTYNTNPPTSGNHAAEPAEWGFYEEELADETLVHNLEHGGTWLTYHADKITDQEKDQLRNLAKKYPARLIITPRAASPSPWVLVSWTRMLKLDSLDLNTVEEFSERNLNKTHEPLAR